MKTHFRFSLLGGIVVLYLLFNSCSKDNDLQTQAQEKEKTSAFGNKVFTGNIIQKVFTENYGQSTFANNTGNNNFTGSGIPGPGGGTPSVGNGSFTYNNKTYPLTFGAFDDYGDGWFEIVFADQAFNIDEEPIDVDAVGFEIRSESSNEISAGYYSYSHSANPNTFDWAGIGIHINTGQEEYYDFIDGNLTISKSGENYGFNFSGMLENGKSVSGYFNGPLTDLDPDPGPTATMNAQVNGVGWSATVLYGYLDNQSSILTVYGENINGEFISLNLDINAVYAGAFLTLNNGINSVVYGNYSTGDYYYANDDASVGISTYYGTTISGNFSFLAEKIVGGNVTVTNGNFSNVSITEY